MDRDEFPRSKPLTGDDYDDYRNYEDDYSQYDDFKYDSYDEPGLTDSDERPLTSSQSEPEYPEYEEEPRNRPYSRRETIQRVAHDQQSGLQRKPGVTAPDSRLSVLGSTTRRTPRVSRYDRTESRRRQPVSRAPQKSKFAMFYIAFLLLAVSVCLVVLVVLLPGMGERFFSLPRIGGTPPTVTTTETPITPVMRADLRSQTALITGIDIHGADTLELLDIGSRRSQWYIVTQDAIITGRNNRGMIFDELRVGDIVDIRYDARTFEIAQINENPRRWERVNRTNVNISMDELLIVHNHDVWNFNSQTIVLHQGEDFSIGQIRPYDSVTLVGYGDTVWLVRVETAHGFLQFVNAERITNGFAMVGSDLLVPFDNMDDDIVLPEGMHVITIDGDNIEPFFQNVRISQGQTERINLNDAELLSARLFFSVTPQYARIFINGTEHINTEPAQVEFGEVLIRVELPGYHPQQQEFVVTTEVANFTFELEEIVVESNLSISTFPTGAVIYINNEHIGVAPVIRAMPPGLHSVVARLPGYESATISVSVTGNETANVERTLVLMPVINDPLANQPAPPVEPVATPTPTPTPRPDFYIPSASPAPFPTIPPANAATPPPAAADTFPEFTPPPAASPPPANDVPWWLQPPTS